MSRCRIIEKKGEWKEGKQGFSHMWLSRDGNSICDNRDQSLIKKEKNIDHCYCIRKYLVPRFIVQTLRDRLNELGLLEDFYSDIKSFTSLDEAREFKRELELEDGIVIE